MTERPEFTKILLHDMEAEALQLVASALPPESLIVEIGSFEGRSTIALGRGALVSQARVIAIDWGKGTPEEGWWEEAGDYTARYEKNLRFFGVSEVVETLRENSRIIAGRWPYGPIDFLFVDGGHAYEQVKIDLAAFQPQLRAGAVVALHDFSPGWPEVVRAATEVFPRCMEAKMMQVVQTLFFRWWDDD